MTFRDFVLRHLREQLDDIRASRRKPTIRDYQAAIADAVTLAAADLSGKVMHRVAGVGVEVDTSSDYDPSTDTFLVDVHLRMVGLSPYSASAAFLGQGFTFLADDGTYHVAMSVPRNRIEAAT